MRINDILFEFAPAGGGGSGDYFQALASAWYNGVFDTGSLPKGIKTQQDVERLLNRGIVCPDGKTRKLHIDYNSDFDGVEIYSDDYYEYGDHDDTIDSRTGQKWGPYDFMAFSDEDLSEGLNEFAADDGDSGEDDVLRKYAQMWWNGDDATQQKIEAALARMGWEIGEDEGGYDNGGVFVVRAGDEHGRSYTSWSAEDLAEGVAEGSLNEASSDEAWELVGQPVPEIQQFVKQMGYGNDEQSIAKITSIIDRVSSTQIPATSIPKLKNLANKGNDAQTLKAIQQISGRPDAEQQYTKLMQARDAGEGRNRDVSGYIQYVKSGNYDPPVLLKLPTGVYVIGGRTRLYAALALGVPANVKIISANNFKQGVAEGVYRGDWVRHPDNPWQIGQIQSIDNGQAAVIWKKTDKRKKAMSSTHAVDALQHARREFSQLTQPTHTPGMAEDTLDEKSTSQAQFRTMAAAAHNPEFARKVGIKQSVAQEFNRADRGQDYKSLPKKADESKKASAEKEADYGDDYQAMVQRVKRLAGLGPLKTQYDPQKRVYRNMPTAVQPKK